MSDSSQRYYGKHRGIVLSNIDPEQRGRLLVQVPSVTGEGSAGWALPSFPFTGLHCGWYAVPQIGAGVWVEFEAGDPDYPIWTGCWYGSSDQLPSAATSAPPLLPSIVVASQTGHVIELKDTPGSGGIILKSRNGAKIEITDAGIIIDNGLGAKIEVRGQQVSINDGAWVV